MSRWIPPHDECRLCRWFSRKGPGVRCKLCGAGEFFEERISDEAPSNDDLMKVYEHMIGEGSILNQEDIAAIAAKSHEEDEDDRRE